MRKTIAILASVAFSGSAFGADMVVKAPPLSAAPGFNWSGFYAGGNIGYGWGTAESNITLTVPTFPVGPVPATIPDSVDPQGLIGGVQIGSNWQFSAPWVVGLEADWQGSGQKAAGSLPPQPSTSLLGVGTIQTNYNANIEWFGTVRGRIGYALDRVLIYATGGLAYGEVKIVGNATDSGTVLRFPYSETASFSGSTVNAGWTLGGGIEGVLVGNWTWKAEYLYLDLGSLDTSATATGINGAEPVSTHTHFTDNVVRAGLNYHFNGL